jgi:malate synthase
MMNKVLEGAQEIAREVAKQRAETEARARALQSLFEHPGWKYVVREWEQWRQQRLHEARAATDSFGQTNAFLKADIAYMMLTQPMERLAQDVAFLNEPS